MRLPLAVSAAALIAVAAAACSAGQTSNYIAPSAGTGSAVTAGGPIVLSQSATVESAGSANGITGALTFGSGTGTVTSVASATAPFGVTPVVPASVKRIVLASSATSPNVFYVTITSTTGASLSGLPSVSLALPAPAIGTYQEAQYNGTAFVNVVGATATMNAAGTALTFPPTATPITIAPNGSIYLAFYQGNFPNATPAPVALPSNVLADSGFDSGVYGAFGTPVNATGWTQCTINKSAPGAAAPNRAFSTFTPTPGSTPGAFILAKGTSVPIGTATPVPTASNVPVTSGNYAATFGGVFKSFDLEDLRYNGLCQIVTVPFNATMTMNVWASGNDGTSFYDFEVQALDLNGLYLGHIYEDLNPIKGPSSGGDTAYRPVTIPTSAIAPFAGQTIQLFVGAWIDGGSSTGATLFSTYYFVDDALLIGTKS